MESIIIKKALVIDPQSEHHGLVRDILIEAGTIAAIAPDLKPPPHAEEWHAEGAAVSQGWVDLQSHFYDPGAEHKEGLENGANAGAHGGFTHVVLNANPHATPDNKSAVSFLQAQAHDHACTLHPVATVSQKSNGQSLSEMHDLAASGAVAFSDDAPIDKTEMLRRALEYAHELTQPVISLPLDMGLNAGAQMHEGSTSTHMGVTGNPTESEVMRIQRDLEVLKYTGGKLHFSVISSAESVELIRAAKARGLNVTCATTANHLHFVDEDLHAFDGTLKGLPPCRAQTDREALRHGIIDGTIDAIVSDHRPEDLEHHDVEFSLASFGMACIESTFPVALSALHSVSKKDALTAAVNALSSGPRKVLGFEHNPIMPGELADLTWFHPGEPWKNRGITKGANVAESIAKHGQTLVGNPLGTVQGTRSFLRN